MRLFYLLVQLHEAALVLYELSACRHVIDRTYCVGHLQVRFCQQLPQPVVLRQDL